MKRIVLLSALLVLSPRNAAAILGGTADPAPSSVVALSGEDSSGASRLVCSGTLVAPNVVLTARHCVEQGNPACTDTFTGAAKYVRIGVTTENGVYEVARTHVPATNSPCGDDVALLVLATAVPASDSPIAEVRLTTAVRDEPYSAVGYGRICADSGSQCSSNGQRLRKDGLAVECIDCRPRTWRGTSDSTCVGDSGGPAFDANKQVFGVTSVGGLGCTTAYYTRLDGHAAFLRDTVKAVTTKAGLAAPAWTSEGGGAGGAGDAAAAEVDGGTGTNDGGATPAPAADEGGCAIARRSRTRSNGAAVAAAVAVVALAAARRRSNHRRVQHPAHRPRGIIPAWKNAPSTTLARTTTSSARATRSIAGRTIPAATTRCSTISRSSSSRGTARARTSSSAGAGPASSSSA